MEYGLRPLRAVGSASCGLYEPEAVGAIGAYAPEGSGKAEKRHRAKNPDPEDQAFNIGELSSELRKNFIFMNFFIKGLAVDPQNL